MSKELLEFVLLGVFGVFVYCFVYHCLFYCPFSFGNCIVCPSDLSLLISPFDIFKLFFKVYRSKKTKWPKQDDQKSAMIEGVNLSHYF